MKKIFNYIYNHKIDILYAIILIATLISVIFMFTQKGTKTFFQALEAKTFDFRQNLIAERKHVNEDIIIVTVDDASYEYMLNLYGDWPAPRDIYANFLDYVESYKPAIVAFDLMFVNSLRSKPGSDEQLIKAIAKYDNVFTAMNFDDQPAILRKPSILPEYLKSEIEVNSDYFEPHVYTNCRAILRQIIDSTPNIGHINSPRTDDGVIRTLPLFISYPDYTKCSPNDNHENLVYDYYPYMTLKAVIKYLNQKFGEKFTGFVVDKDNNITFNGRKYPMTSKGEVILNWYGQSGYDKEQGITTFNYVPFWKILQSIDARKNGESELFEKDYFKDKIIYLGTSVFALSDIKTVPTDRYMPGVELHATLFNNLLDGSLIKVLPTSLNILITILFAALIVFTVFKIRNIIASSILFIGLLIGYFFLTETIMEHFYIWLWIAFPYALALFVFIVSYLLKYFIKSRDFDYTYKLATTDGLTELHNHRFFQEQMRACISQCEKSNSVFSLVYIDIDFFKKFNDKYGHQVGDAVLKEVGQTLKKSVRNIDYVCRYGGEEMAIILNGTEYKDALTTAQKLCDTIAQKSMHLSPEIITNVTISLGVSTYPKDGKTPTELIEAADKNLYHAKENGRNQVGNFVADKQNN